MGGLGFRVQGLGHMYAYSRAHIPTYHPQIVYLLLLFTLTPSPSVKTYSYGRNLDKTQPNFKPPPPPPVLFLKEDRMTMGGFEDMDTETCRDA